MELDDEKTKALENFCRKKICSDKILDLEDKKERTEYYDRLSKSMIMYSKQEENPSESIFYKEQFKGLSEDLNDGFGPYINEKVEQNGNNFSGGQKQRLAIARAILYDGDIYIFDEATSNVDVDSEENIINIIKEISKTKTVILISHRLYNCRFSDIIYFLKDGTIIEKGTHKELMELEGFYKTMYNTQYAL